MPKHYHVEEKERIVALYSGGQSSASLSSQYGIPRSTLFSWIRKLNQKDPVLISKQYLDLKRHTDKLEMQVEVIKAAGCGTEAPLREKLVALEKLYGQYSVHGRLHQGSSKWKLKNP